MVERRATRADLKPWRTEKGGGQWDFYLLGWVYWHSTARLHSYLGDIPPAEFEAAFYDDPRTDQLLIGIQ